MRSSGRLGPSHASREVGADLGVLCAAEPVSHGLLAGPRFHPFSELGRGFARRPSPAAIRRSGSSSLVSLPLQSSFARPPAPSFRSGPYLPGFSALFATSPETSTIRERSTARFVPPSGFLDLSTVYSVSGFAGLFHPAATCRVRLCSAEAHPRPPDSLIASTPRATRTHIGLLASSTPARSPSGESSASQRLRDETLARDRGTPCAHRSHLLRCILARERTVHIVGEQ